MFLKIDTSLNNKIYLNLLDDLIKLLKEYREKIKEEIEENDEWL